MLALVVGGEPAAGVEPPGPADLQALIAATPRCLLNPVRFFVSWNGVLTLVYSGFPPALVKLKAAMRGSFEALPTENPGSKWPKTTLGCVKDGKRLTPSELETLNAICAECSAALGLESDTLVEVDVLSMVLYQCRSLERRVSEWRTPLAAASGRGGVDEAAPAAEEVARVADVVKQAEGENYWFAASRDGNREAHYRGTYIGATLVHPLQCTHSRDTHRHASAAALPGLLAGFQAKVEAAMPGMYAFFAPESLHVTLQALVG
mmetsp:Transcript_14691/g.37746  ORF Transcript_14691/g.37746 Transcript_14691/m.37746 type:complete len:263 (+) Transcript_14691:272-1060(+)|eukprot:jgi/Tetstr1/424145/TSEL_014752.t1